MFSPLIYKDFKQEISEIVENKENQKEGTAYYEETNFYKQQVVALYDDVIMGSDSLSGTEIQSRKPHDYSTSISASERINLKT